MDCAICKDQFKLGTEDPDEQIVVTLPCTHPFHEGCIVPWIKSSGTCPVCRYALVPQPEQHGSGQERPNSATNPSTNPSTYPLAGPPTNPHTNPHINPSSGPTPRPSGGRSTDGLSGFFNNMLSSISGGHAGSGSSSRTTRSRTNASAYERSRTRRQGGGTNEHSHPGGWSEQVD